jgi:hypothetical protein
MGPPSNSACATLKQNAGWDDTPHLGMQRLRRLQASAPTDGSAMEPLFGDLTVDRSPALKPYLD